MWKGQGNDEYGTFPRNSFLNFKGRKSSKHYFRGCGIGESHGLECCGFLFLIWVFFFLLTMNPKSLIIGYDYFYSWTKLPCYTSSKVDAILSQDFVFYLLILPLLYSLGKTVAGNHINLLKFNFTINARVFVFFSPFMKEIHSEFKQEAFKYV